MVALNKMEDYLQLTGGWNIDWEDFSVFDGSAYDGEDEVLAMRGHFNPKANTSYDAREILRTESQGRQGACQGFTIASSSEWAACCTLGEKSLELSPAMGYYETQRIDGIRGDRGSTINGGVKLAKTTGICPLELWPYPSRYNPARPSNFEAVLAAAERFKIFHSIRLRTVEGVKTFLEAGLGAVTIGIRWNSSTNREHVTSFRGGSGGGHAICLPQRSRKRPGETDMMNSWGLRWGDRGWATWTDKALGQMLKDRYTVAVGISDMQNLEPRVITFREFTDIIDF